MSMREKILEHLKNVESLPTYVGQIVTELQRDDVDLPAVVDLIELEPTLTASVLKLVNSSAFAAEHHISSIQEASVRLGSYNLMQMVIGSSMAKVMSNNVPGYDLPPGELWKSSITTAIYTDVICDVLKINAPSHTFTAGLLRDIGKIVLGTFVNVDVTQILNYSATHNVTFPDAEYAILGVDHAEVGAALMKLWNLPEELCIPVRWHHKPECAESEKLVTSIVHFADTLTTLSGTGIGNDGLLYNVSAAVVEELKISINDIEKIMCQAMDQVQGALEMFSD